MMRQLVPREALNKERRKTRLGHMSHSLSGMGTAQLTGDVLSGERSCQDGLSKELNCDLANTGELLLCGALRWSFSW